MKKSLLALFFVFVITDASTMDCSNTTTQMREVICSETKLITLYEDVFNVFHQVRDKVNISNLPILDIQFVTWNENTEKKCILNNGKEHASNCLTKRISDEIKLLNNILNNPDWSKN